MKKGTILLYAAFFICLVMMTKAGIDNFPILKGPYLGQKAPGMTPEIFAPGVISTEKKGVYVWVF